MIFRNLIAAVLILTFFQATGQGITADFNAPEDVCMGQRIQIQNTSVNATAYQWDFCHEDLSDLPEISEIVINKLETPTSIEMVFDNDRWYGFLPSRDNSKLFRLDYGESLDSIPMVVEMSTGDFSDLLFRPCNIEFVRENGVWYGIIVDFVNGNLLRAEFGAGLNAPPTETIDLGNPGALSSIGDMEIVNDGDEWVVLITSFSGNKMNLINFGNSITNTVDPSDVIEVTGFTQPYGISVIRDQGLWYAFVANFNGGTISRVEFGAEIFASPQSVNPAYTAAGATELSINKEGDHYILYVSTTTGEFHYVNFGSSLLQSPLSAQNLGNLGVLHNTWGLSIVRSAPSWRGFLIDYVNKTVLTAKFDATCTGLSMQVTDLQTPPVITISEPGNHPIELTAYGENGQATSTIKNVTVSALEAPDIAFSVTPEDLCKESVTFTAENSSENITSYEWDFGDEATSSSSGIASHAYESNGLYEVSLNVMADNACENFVVETIQVYVPPTASFELPGNPICTNSEILITNTTTDNYDGLLSYEWYVNDELQENLRDLSFVFEEPGVAKIRLVASLPGCSDEIIQLTPELQAGPELAFSFDEVCQHVEGIFTSTVSEPVKSYQWLINDEAISDQADHAYTFEGAGEFSIRLTVETESGCHSTVSDEIAISPRPSPDFEFPNASVYCSDTPISFNNTTPGSPAIESALWHFGDDAGTPGDNIEEHVYEEGGLYDVVLTVVTDQGCSNTIEKKIAISDTPSLSVSYSSLCLGLPVEFGAETEGNIASWTWQIGDKQYTIDRPEHIFRVPGTHNYSLRAVDINGCSSQVNDAVDVPEILEPDFSVSKNCVNESAVLMDITEGADVVVGRSWQIDDMEVSIENPAAVTFSETGTRTVVLSVVTQAGCSYATSKEIEVVPVPQASFSISSEIGSPPFPVDFTNRSEGATDYAWDFGDGNTSNEESPAHEYTEVGEFTITLTSSNPEGCEDSSTKKITISPARPDIRIMAVTTSENPDKTVGIMVTLINEGNTIVYDLPLDIDISGAVQIREIIQGPVFPRSRVNFSLGYGVNVTEDITFLCATATLAGDVEPETNKNCIEFASEVVFLPGYPNPAKEFFQIQWIAPQEETVRASLKNILGNEIWTLQFTSEKGLNQKTIEVQNLQKGIYMLILESPRVTTMQRILIAR